MIFLYCILPLVSSALAKSLIQCSCQLQDCSKAANSCTCENQNIVNKYFCCDANTVPPKDLGLKDCKAGTPSFSNLYLPLEDYKGLCGGPRETSCPDHGTCNSLSGNWAEYPLAWGLCSYPDQRGIVYASSPSPTIRSQSRNSTGPATSTVSVASIASASFSNSSSTPTVPLSTSTVFETTMVAPSTLVTVTSTTTVAPSPPVTTITTTTSTTSTKSVPSPTSTASGCNSDTDCVEGFYCDNGSKCPPGMTAFMGWDCTGTCTQKAL